MIREYIAKKMSSVYSTIDRFVFSMSLNDMPDPNFVEAGLINELRADVSGVIKREPVRSKIDISWTKRLCDLILQKDPRGFLSWDVIRETMFIGNALYMKSELKYLKNRSDWDSCWKIIMDDNKNGFPEKYMKSNANISNNTMHQVYHLARFSECTGLSVKNLDFIVEFGGGYGDMCRLVHRLGFKGKYIIYDMPIMSIFQKYFLKSNFIKALNNYQAFIDNDSGVFCVSDINVLRRINVFGRSSLFIATWSISEVDLDLRERFVSIPLIDDCKNYLIGHSNIFYTINNIKYFDKWIERKEKISWKRIKIDHIAGQNYIFGQTRI